MGEAHEVAVGGDGGGAEERTQLLRGLLDVRGQRRQEPVERGLVAQPEPVGEGSAPLFSDATMIATIATKMTTAPTMILTRVSVAFFFVLSRASLASAVAICWSMVLGILKSCGRSIVASLDAQSIGCKTRSAHLYVASDV